MTILTKEQWKASVAETWSAAIKATYQHLIDEAVKAEREKVAKQWEQWHGFDKHTVAAFIRARGDAK